MAYVLIVLGILIFISVILAILKSENGWYLLILAILPLTLVIVAIETNNPLNAYYSSSVEGLSITTMPMNTIYFNDYKQNGNQVFIEEYWTVDFWWIITIEHDGAVLKMPYSDMKFVPKQLEDTNLYPRIR